MKGLRLKQLLLPFPVAALLAIGGCAGTGAPADVELSQSQADFTETGDARNRARANTELAALYYERGNLGVALEVLRTATSADPGYAPAHGMLGLVYMDLRENQLAQQSFERALRYAPNDADINHNYGWFLCQTGKEVESMRYFNRAIANPLYRTPGKSFSAAGQCALKKDNFKDAAEYFSRALKLDPDEPLALLNMAGINYRLGQIDEARKLINRYSKVVEPSAEGLWLAVRIERKVGDKTTEGSYANQLRRRFPGSKEYQQMQRGEYD
ncbi:MAG: type IV pilus biogenesis/stability protein PilW [Proteobacteria bacterium]|nr:type IV pilus biogenesis/stability protein PilW [Pseudomonadota bacterium]